MYKIFILFLLPSSQRRPMKANAGQRRPTQAHEGPQQPTTANEGQRRPMKAHSSQRRPTKAHGSQRRPTAANDGQRRPTQAHEDKKGPNNAIWRRLGPRYVFFFIFFILFLLLRDSGHPTRTRTPRNPYPGTRVRVFWGTGTGSPGKPQGYPCQSLTIYCTISTSSDSHRSQGLWPVRNVTDVPGHRSFGRKHQNSGHKRKKCVFLSRKNNEKSQPPEIISLYSKVQN